MTAPSSVERTHAAALVVAMVEAEHLEEAEEFVDWWELTFEHDLSYALPAELE